MSNAPVIVAPMIEKVSELGIEAAIAWEMEPFDENGEWFRDGSRWDWYQTGGRWDGMLGGKNIVQIKNLDLASCERTRTEWLAQDYKDYSSRPNNPFSDIEKGESLEQYVARKRKDAPSVYAYAFLHNRHWNEPERMGWFGTTTYTECERKDMGKPVGDPSKWFGKCLHKDEATGARVICWNEPEEIWRVNYFMRFLEPLGIEQTIAVVDYHV